MRILVIDDEKLIRWSLAERLGREGYGVSQAETGRAGLDAFDAQAPDLVLLDLRLPDMDGLSVMRALRARAPELPVIIITGFSSVDTAIEAMKQGADDYVAKPFNLDELVLAVRRTLEASSLRREAGARASTQEAAFGAHAIVGSSPAIHAVVELVGKVARSEAATILLRGESGSGKDLVAKALHVESPRAGFPFVNITCTALPDTLLESELFGYEKGAFTDAKNQKKGLFEVADGGTVFLDEIGDMPPSLQSKVLRVLEERAFRRIGGTEDIRVNVRVIAATNRNLEEAIANKTFREDLYFRMNVITIDLPPLRSRREDIAPLARHFADRFAREFRKGAPEFSPEAMARLQGHDWPGNVRELRNAIERAVLLGEGTVIRPEDVVVGRPGPAADPASYMTLGPGGLSFEALEKDLVTQALDQARGNQTRAGELLGMSRDQIHYRIEKFGLRSTMKRGDLHPLDKVRT